jgi:hypothetical protein
MATRKKTSAAPRQEAPRPAPTNPTRPPEPGPIALSRIAALVARGTSPIRVTQEVESIVASWLANAAELERMEIRERLEEMEELLAEGEESARTQIDDMDLDGREAKAAAAASERALAALQAARSAVASASQQI